MQEASQELEAFIEEGHRRAVARGYPNTGFMQMRARYGTIEAITRLVKRGEIKSGLRRMIELDLADWTIDAAVANFPKCFPPEVRAAAQWRLSRAKELYTPTSSPGKEAYRSLEAFIEEGHRRAVALGYANTGFMQMRARYGTISAITRLVTSGEIKSGLRRMIELGLAEWTIDAAVAKFPERFPADVQAAAQWRLLTAKKLYSRTSIPE